MTFKKLPLKFTSKIHNLNHPFGISVRAVNTKIERGKEMSKMSKVHELVPWFDIIIVFELLSTPTGAWLNAHFELQKGSQVRWFLSASFFWSSSSLTQRVRHTNPLREDPQKHFDVHLKSEQLHVNHSRGNDGSRCPYNVNYLPFWLPMSSCV